MIKRFRSSIWTSYLRAAPNKKRVFSLTQSICIESDRTDGLSQCCVSCDAVAVACSGRMSENAFFEAIGQLAAKKFGAKDLNRSTDIMFADYLIPLAKRNAADGSETAARHPKGMTVVTADPPFDSAVTALFQK